MSVNSLLCHIRCEIPNKEETTQRDKGPGRSAPLKSLDGEPCFPRPHAPSGLSPVHLCITDFVQYFLTDRTKQVASSPSALGTKSHSCENTVHPGYSRDQNRLVFSICQREK